MYFLTKNPHVHGMWPFSSQLLCRDRGSWLPQPGFFALEASPGTSSTELASGNQHGWKITNKIIYPICSMYGIWIFTNICPKNHPNVGKYTIHGAYGYKCVFFMGSSNELVDFPAMFLRRSVVNEDLGDETFQKGLQLQRLRNALIDQPGHISCRHDEGFCEECRKMTLAVEEMAHVIHTFLHTFPAIRLFLNPILSSNNGYGVVPKPCPGWKPQIPHENGKVHDKHPLGLSERILHSISGSSF